MIILIKNVAIIGGDLRSVKLAGMLEKEGYIVNSYALEKEHEIINRASSIKECIENADIVIGQCHYLVMENI